MKRYEVMFLFDSAVGRDWNTVTQEVQRLCSRIGATLLVCVKYDERKLAYEIKKRKRGTYALAYMDAPAERIAEFERDARLSELILRTLVLRGDKLTAEKLAALQAHPVDQPLWPLGDGRRHDDDFGGHGDRHDRGERGDRGDRRRSRSSEEREPQPVGADEGGDEGEER